MQFLLILVFLILKVISKDIINSLNNQVHLSNNQTKKDVAWISSMYSTHRNWLNKRNNPFKPLNEVIKINK